MNFFDPLQKLTTVVELSNSVQKIGSMSELKKKTLTLCKDPPPIVTVAVSDEPWRSHAVKNASQSKDNTDNTPTDKTEQLTFGMKQSLSFQIVIL